MQDAGKLNKAELEEALADEVQMQTQPDFAELETRVLAAQAAGVPSLNEQMDTGRLLPQGVQSKSPTQRIPMGPPEAAPLDRVGLLEKTVSGLSRDLRALLADKSKMRPNDWAETASKEQLKTATRVERERANRMEKLLADAVNALAQADRRELQLSQALKDTAAPVEQAKEKLDAAISKTDALYESFSEDTQKLVSRLSVASASLDEQKGVWLNEMRNARIEYERGVSEVKAAHADLVNLRDTINAKLGELNLRLRKAGA